MIKEWYFKIPKKIRISIYVILAVILVGFVYFIFSSFSKTEVPSSFVESRVSASNYANDIISLLGLTSENLKKIQEFDKNYQYGMAMNMIVSEMNKNKDARGKAVSLALELEKMARLIPEINSDKAGQTALVAISSETALIGKLISYNEYLSQLLNLLKDKMNGGGVDYKKINTIVDVLNSEVVSINDLNRRFDDLMVEFDEIVN